MSAKKKPETFCRIQLKSTNTEDFTQISVLLYNMNPNTVVTMTTTREKDQVSPWNRINKIYANRGCDQKEHFELLSGGMIRVSLETGEMKYNAQYHLRSIACYKPNPIDENQKIFTHYAFELIRDEVGLSCQSVDETSLEFETREAPNVIPQNSLFS